MTVWRFFEDSATLTRLTRFPTAAAIVPVVLSSRNATKRTQAAWSRSI